MHRITLLAIGALLGTIVSFGQTFKVTPATLSFTYQLGDTKLPASVALGVTVSGGSTQYAITALSSGGPWLTVSPDTSKTPATLKVAVNPTSLPIGTYNGTISIASAAAGGPASVNVPVILTIKAAPATLSVTPNPLTVNYTRGGAAVPTEFLTLSGNGALMSYTVSVAGATWLTATPASGILFQASRPPSASISILPD